LSQQKRRLAVARTKLIRVGTKNSPFLHTLLPRLTFALPLGTDHQRIVKLDRENEVAPPAKVAPSVGRVRVFCIYIYADLMSIIMQAMQAARMEMKLSQKDVAQKINEKPSVLQDYEAGKAVPNPQILAKLERVLAVKLRGTLKSFPETTIFSICLCRPHKAMTLARSWRRRSRDPFSS
jgi:transcriptional regulator with XRE-family HTH domain